MNVKETREVLEAFVELSVFCIKTFKDGVQVDDFITCYQKLTADSMFQAQLEAAFDGIAKVPAEVSDIDINETVELASVLLSKLPYIMEAIGSSDGSDPT
jgi:hypothetical protein